MAIVAAPASAATFTSDHCGQNGGECGPQPTGFATITGTQVNANTVSITITPLNGNGLVGGVNGLTTFTFNSLQNQNITFDFGLQSALFNPVNEIGTTNTAAVGSIHQDGFGDFEYGFEYLGGPGGSNPFFSPLTFTLSSATGLSLADFTELSKNGDQNAYLALDIISGTTGKTGVVDCCGPGITPFSAVPGPIVGAGAPGLVAACIALFGLHRRRRKLAV